MVYRMDDKKVLSAIDCIVKDTDKKYDECLVERFLEFIQSSCRSIQAARPILDRLKFFIDHKAFVMLNQTRAFKTFHSILKANEDELYLVLPYLDSLWNSLGMIIINNNLSAMTVVLSILELLVRSEEGYNWLINKKIEPSVKKVKDIATLARYYIENSNNYHTKNKAERLFEALVLKDLPPAHPQSLAIQKIIRELMDEGSASIIYILLNIMETGLRDKNLLWERYNILEIMNDSFIKLIEQPNKNINNLCKFLALASSPTSFSVILKDLKSKNKLEAIVIYLSNSSSKDNTQLLLTYLLYPLLTNCSGNDTDILIQKLVKSELDFIDKNMSVRLTTLCLVYLNQISGQKSCSYTFKNDQVTLIANTSLNYIKCHHASMRNYRNVMECCSIFGKLKIQEETVILHSLESIDNIIISIDCNDQTKPILLDLLKVMQSAHHEYSRMVSSAKSRDRFFKTVDLAFRFDDHDIMNEFVRFFITNEFNFNLEHHDVQRYFDLVWKHMYLKAKRTEHRELLGNLAHLLIQIDLEVKASILEGQGLRRHHEIPTLLGDILAEHSAILPTIEGVIDALVSIPLVLYTEDSSTTPTIGYVCRLDSPTLPVTVKMCLDHLTLGLCITTKGEVGECTRIGALQLINDLVMEIIINSDSTKCILARLVRTGILETLYEIITGSMYSSLMYEKAKSRIGLIKTAVVAKLSEAGNSIINQLVSSSDRANGEAYRKRLVKAQSIADFYLSELDYTRTIEDLSTQTGDKMELSSMVDDILNYELISDGISDCY